MTDLAWMRERLARLCGLTAESGQYLDGEGRVLFSIEQEGYLDPDWWSPDLDVAQAVRCLEAMTGPWEKTLFTEPEMTLNPWSCRIEHQVNRAAGGHAEAATLPRAICLAIAAALGWEKPGGT